MYVWRQIKPPTNFLPIPDGADAEPLHFYLLVFKLVVFVSTRSLTSPEYLWNRAISRVWTVDQGLTDTALNVTSRALFAVARMITLHRFGPYIRNDRVVRESVFSVTQWRC